MRRPALNGVFSFAAGIILGHLVNLPVFILFYLLILLLGLLLYLVLKEKQKTAAIILILALVTAGFFRYEASTRDFSTNHIVHFVGLDKYFRVEGKISDLPDVREDKTLLVVEVKKISYENKEMSTCGQILLRIKEPTYRFSYGDRIRFGGYINQPGGKRNPGAFDYRKYLANKQIFGIVYLRQDDNTEIVNRESANAYYSRFIYPLRGWILRLFDHAFSPLPRALMSGFLLGETRNIPQSIYQMFRDTGTLHLLAVSGSNVALVVLIVLGLLRTLRIPRVYAALVCMAVIVVFSNLVQNEPSVVRAGIMAGVALIGLLLYKNPDGLNIVSFAAFLILACSPLLLFDVGFQLSFISVFGIIYLVPKISRLVSGLVPRSNKSLWRWVIYPSAVSLAVELVVLPILAYYFNFVPIITVVANLFIVPLASLSVLIGCVLIAIGAISFKLASLVGWAGNLILNLTVYVLNFFGHLPVSKVKVASPSLFFMLNYYLVLVFLFEAGSSKKMRKILVFYAILLLCFWVWSSTLSSKARWIEFTFLDVGRGEAAVLRTGDGQTVLFNAGGIQENFNRAEGIVVPYLLKNGITDLDGLILTNRDENNANSVQSLRNEVTVKKITDLFADSLETNSAGGMWSLVDVRQRKSAKDELLVNLVRVKGKGEPQRQFNLVKVEFGNTSFCVLDDQTGAYAGNLSLLGNCSVVILPEINIDLERTEELIRLHEPELVLLTGYDRFESKGNLLNRLRGDFPQVEFHSLRENGAVIFKTDGKNLKVKLTIKE